jgi:hypothetical protein
MRVRANGADERVSLGNEKEGWDEVRVEAARKQLLAKIELGLWTPQPESPTGPFDEEPTFRELATDWLNERRRNPAIRPRTIELNEMQLRRYLAPFFGELLPSQITRAKIKQYRKKIHIENEQIRTAEAAGRPLRRLYGQAAATAVQRVDQQDTSPLSGDPRRGRGCRLDHAERRAGQAHARSARAPTGNRRPRCR